VSLLAAYSFDESGTTVIDYTGRGNSFAITADATRGVGHTGGGLTPNGTTAVPMPNVGVTDNRTVMMWIKGTMPDGWPVQWYSTSLTAGAWGILHLGTDICIKAANATTYVQPSQTWDATAWHHVAGTYDGVTVKLYVDGVLADSAALSGPLLTDTATTLFGWSGTSQHDDLRIYDSALDAASITTAMNMPVVVGSLTSAAALAVDTGFLSRVTAAMEFHGVTLGNAIIAAGSPTAADKARLILAQNALASPSTYASRFGWAIGSDSSIDSTVDDATIEAKVASNWDLIAGVPV
jgi:hypothetical protein